MDGVWLTGTPLPVARTGFGCAAVGKKIYCIGGSSTLWIQDFVNTVLIYDTINDSYSYGTNMPTARSAFGCVAVDEKIYCFGGTNNSALAMLEIYDTVTDTWSSGQSFPVASWHIAYAEVNGEIYAFNGCPYGPIVQKTFKYTPSLDSWSEVAPCAVDSLLFAEAHGGKIYATGGSDYRCTAFNKKLFIYDVQSDSWSEGAEMESSTTMPTTAIFKDKFCCIAGTQAQAGSGSRTMQDYMRIYDIATNSWSFGPVLPTPRHNTRGAVVDGKLYCIGGDNNSGTAYTTVEIFTLEGENNPDQLNLHILLDVNETVDLTGYIHPIAPNVPQLVWSSDDASIASIDQNGKVTGNAVGITKVHVKTPDNSWSAFVRIIVEEEGVSDLRLSILLEPDETCRLKALFLPNGTAKPVVWSSSNTVVATVTSNGKVTALAIGEAIITVQTVDGSLSDYIYVTVIEDKA